MTPNAVVGFPMSFTLLSIAIIGTIFLMEFCKSLMLHTLLPKIVMIFSLESLVLVQHFSPLLVLSDVGHERHLHRRTPEKIDGKAVYPVQPHPVDVNNRLAVFGNDPNLPHPQFLQSKFNSRAFGAPLQGSLV